MLVLGIAERPCAMIRSAICIAVRAGVVDGDGEGIGAAVAAGDGVAVAADGPEPVGRRPPAGAVPVGVAGMALAQAAIITPSVTFARRFRNDIGQNLHKTLSDARTV